ncbi:DMT family transporter [Candidatus Izemoplasma sp. B36]|uniref:DMT family transporter n=1 Tax=Candidatus Izemoplasma sp. B36 TaxID=3242468 RepID=UPI0035590084
MKNKGHIAGIAFALIFGFSFMFSKIALEANITPMGVIAYRFLLAFLVFEILRLTKIVKIRFHKEMIVPVLLVAFFQPILYFIFETYGLNLTTSSEAGMMIALIPIFVTILSSFILNEKPKKIQVLFIILSLSGIILIQVMKPNPEGEVSTFLGFILLFLAVFSAASFNIASRKASKTVKAYETTYYMMLTGAFIFNIIYIIQLVLNNNLNLYFSSISTIDVMLPIMYLGIVASIGGFFLVNYALSKLPAHVSSIYANLSTVVAVLAGHFILGDELTVYTIIGGIMIILGVYGVARTNYKNQIPKG